VERLRLAYAFKKGDKWVAIIDDRVGTDLMGLLRTASVSVCRANNWPTLREGNKFFVVVDEQRGRQLTASSKTFCLQSGWPPLGIAALGNEQCVIVDGKIEPACDAIGIGPKFSPIAAALPTRQ
jgi:hypothetical protein